MANPAQLSDEDICLEVPGYKFWIEIDGKRAKQYQVERGSDIVSCYIASVVNKEFTIVTQRNDQDAMGIHYYLHDDCIDRRVFRLGHWSYRLDHVQTEHGKQRFAFSNINFADDEQMGLAPIPKNLGMITIKLHPIKSVLGSSDSHAVFKLGIASTMSEKSKSIGFHTVSLRPPEANTEPPKSMISVVYADPSKPWFTVKFFYRPLDVLRAQGIASGLQPKPNPEDAVDRQDNDDQGSEAPSLAPKTESTEERKPLVTSKKKAYRTEKSRVMKTIETIIIEDSDSGDNERSKVKTEKRTGSKRARDSSSIGPTRYKRHKTGPKPDPDIIILDSD